MKFKNFDDLMRMVRGKSNRIVVPGANNLEALEACKIADDDGLLSGGIFIGDVPMMKDMAAKVGLKLDKFELADCKDVAEMCRLAVQFVKEGKGDFLVKGLVDSSLYLKAILSKEAGMVEPGSTLSHFVLFETAHYSKLFALADAAILISPDLEQKRKIVQNTAGLLRQLGVEKPKISIVCPVEKVNPKIQSTLDAAELVKMSQDGRIQNAIVEGPYDIYITFSRKLADEKGIKGGVVPGDVDGIVLPDLDAANPTYKSITFFAAGLKSAALVVGAKVPVILPSRTDPPQTKAHSIALASLLKEQRVAA
jgi:phosphate butyryltransferase